MKIYQSFKKLITEIIQLFWFLGTFNVYISCILRWPGYWYLRELKFSCKWCSNQATFQPSFHFLWVWWNRYRVFTTGNKGKKAKDNNKNIPLKVRLKSENYALIHGTKAPTDHFFKIYANFFLQRTTVNK